MLLYLFGVYLLGFLFLMVLYNQESKLYYKDLIMFVLAPIALPMTMLLKLASLVVNLEDVWIER